MDSFDDFVLQHSEMRKIAINVANRFREPVDEIEQQGRILLWRIYMRELKPENVLAYIALSLRRLCIDKYRHRVSRRLVDVDVDDYMNEYMCAPSTPEWSLDWFKEMTVSLSHKGRTLLYRRYVMGHDEQQLAKFFNCKRGTIKSRLSRTLEKVREGYDRG